MDAVSRCALLATYSGFARCVDVFPPPNAALLFVAVVTTDWSQVAREPTPALISYMPLKLEAHESATTEEVPTSNLPPATPAPQTTGRVSSTCATLPNVHHG